ncbi:nuclear transport factor 2 family protein [Actinomycetospora sp. TBRC 11914]|uniref:nuclear transport factor 2 family protein n=1 Tax=Actinomycetospora sp. TBRC 11914 TaxID=2729387 RepID=UPI00145E86EF|nr:nuclear transport factor 2 family protein [Actinomycetospora sp. TBRC 11914]NMO91419.1 nuclear transport factor 2 family protein [Actinomycetospora sp. TBRC 11914]
MVEPSSPEAVVRAVMDGVSRLVLGDVSQVERLVALYAEPTHVVHPMNPAIPPLRSRDDLRAHFAAAESQVGRPDGFAPADVVVHRTTDPEVVVADFHYAVTRHGTTSTIPCVFVVRVRDGLIVDSRDHAGAPR